MIVVIILVAGAWGCLASWPKWTVAVANENSSFVRKIRSLPDLFNLLVALTTFMPDLPTQVYVLEVPGLTWCGLTISLATTVAMPDGLRSMIVFESKSWFCERDNLYSWISLVRKKFVNENAYVNGSAVVHPLNLRCRHSCHFALGLDRLRRIINVFLRCWWSI